MTDKIRVVMLGTPDFAVPTLKALMNAPTVEVVLVITQPDRPVGRKRQLTPSPIKQAAIEYGLPLLQPEKVSAADFVERLETYRPDVMVTAAYGQILSNRLLAVPRYGCLNVHASLLPRWRGAAPIHRAILAGDSETGVTIMKTVKELDAGPILGMQAVAIESSDTTGDLHDRLAEVGADLLVRLLPEYTAGRLVPSEQPEAGVTYAHRIVRKDEWIDLTNTVVQVHNHVRGLSPWPGAALLHGGQPIKLWRTALLPENSANDSLPEGSSGTVCMTNDGSVRLKCEDGWLEILEVQPSGKRKMSARDWFRGLRIDKTQFEPVEENG
ncbi:methionyl-tRNA formyltransferase [Alicyclobacillus ferrooxydans]|uniref:Methionyl-tRNA formyltransferase n=1 Tax=Alicyclobacillus ferrooxydans TaxID=471514 RepID=A0A0P9CIZ3_9BACL|nr:methionyl-tRNA formyltransferase [Alicyclobacillus ferrooxydans]KPV45346.1 hypothetical protein AN477_03070 [Alicyclobacillus ferrooxydans]